VCACVWEEEGGRGVEGRLTFECAKAARRPYTLCLSLSLSLSLLCVCVCQCVCVRFMCAICRSEEKNVFCGPKIRRKSPPRSHGGILFASPQVLHRTRSHSFLEFTQQDKMQSPLGRGVMVGSCSLAREIRLAARFPQIHHVWITANQLVRHGFHKNEFDDMLWIPLRLRIHVGLTFQRLGYPSLPQEVSLGLV